ncbi:MAG: fimbrillin family protein [Bacteroidales bacterium]|nr:fimbrillin family protein [Bacteroidales bacterium]
MRKIYAIAIAVLSTIALSSCVQEERPNGGEATIGENDLSFVMSSLATRSSEVAEVSVTDYEMKVPSIGKILYMEEILSTLEGVPGEVPATRGTPAYTTNVGSLYGAFNLNAYQISGSSLGEQVIPDGSVYAQEGSETWVRKFDSDPWGDNETLHLFMRMPADQAGASGYSYGYADGQGTIRFDYETPAQATAQQDILFASRPIVKAERPSTGGYPVFFQHALTGIKFRMGNELSLKEDGSVDPTKTRTYITKVEFIGLVNSGTCTVTPGKENDDYTDEASTYSSSDAVSWDLGDTPNRSTADAPIYQAFGDGDLVDFGAGEHKFPDSFYSYSTGAGDRDGLDKNINDENASMTFWLIPQTLSDDVQVKVTVKIVSGDDVNDGNEVTLDLGHRLSGTEWKAGQLRTFTIKPDVVGIKITDEMNSASTVKSNVVIKNLGNVKEYVRVNIIANWVGQVQTAEGVYQSENTVLMGYPDAEGGLGNYTNYKQVPTWNDKDFTLEGGTKVYHNDAYPEYSGYGTFVGLPPMGSKTAPGDPLNGWIRHDKYYYYMDPIGPGDSVLPETAPLFESYTVGASPVFYIADATGERRMARNVHLEMDVLVQAIRVPVDENGDPTKTYAEAWAEELHVSVDKLNDL